MLRAGRRVGGGRAAGGGCAGRPRAAVVAAGRQAGRRRRGLCIAVGRAGCGSGRGGYFVPSEGASACARCVARAWPSSDCGGRAGRVFGRGGRHRAAGVVAGRQAGRRDVVVVVCRVAVSVWATAGSSVALWKRRVRGCRAAMGRAVVAVESGSTPLWAAPACGPRAARGWPSRRRGSRRPRCRARGRRSGRASWARWAPCCSGRGDRAEDGDGPRAAPAAPRAACRGSRRPWGGVEAVSLCGHRCEVCVGREADRAGDETEPRGGAGVRAGRRGRGRLCGSRRS